MIKQRRKQLTLFIDDEDAVQIENFRSEYNPIQFAFIGAHITLCREDEIEDLDLIVSNLEHINFGKLNLTLGSPNRTANGNGLMPPGLDKTKQFRKLRTNILSNTGIETRSMHAHLTLMHPRNSKCSIEIFNLALTYDFPTKISFSKIHLIEETESGKWNILSQYAI